MSNFYNSLKAFITPEMISKVATFVGEKDSHISSASSSIIASLLGVLHKKGDATQIKNILEEGANLNILDNVKDMFNDERNLEHQAIGDKLLEQLLGDKAAAFTDPIATNTGLSSVITNKLIAMIAPVVAAFLGKKLIDNKWNMTELRDEIGAQGKGIAKHIPSDLIKSFGLSSLLHEPNEKIQVGSNNNSNSNVSANNTDFDADNNDSNTTVKTEKVFTKQEAPKNNMGWLKWLLLLLLLALMFFWWKSCQKNTDTIVEGITTEISTIETPSLDNLELNLPGGLTINAIKGSIEDKMMGFLNSDELKNATAEQLANKWFEFDDIIFKFGSTTELETGEAQLDNIAAILKSHSEVKVQIAANTDKKGSEATNMAISLQRAKTIEKMLESRGVSATQIVKAEGHGETEATHSTNESDQARAEDRDVALRFVK